MGTRTLQDLSDADLDAYVLARLRSVGVDLDVLPDDEPDAPVDRRRVLLAARRFLRSTPGVILGWEPEPEDAVPYLYPASLGVALGAGREGGEA